MHPEMKSKNVFNVCMSSPLRIILDMNTFLRHPSFICFLRQSTCENVLETSFFCPSRMQKSAKQGIKWPHCQCPCSGASVKEDYVTAGENNTDCLGHWALQSGPSSNCLRRDLMVLHYYSSSGLTKNWCHLQVKMRHIMRITQQEMVSSLCGSEELSMISLSSVCVCMCVFVMSTKTEPLNMKSTK